MTKIKSKKFKVEVTLVKTYYVEAYDKQEAIEEVYGSGAKPLPDWQQITKVVGKKIDERSYDRGKHSVRSNTTIIPPLVLHPEDDIKARVPFLM